MPRALRPKPPGEHLSQLTRQVRQIQLDDTLSQRRRQNIMKHLGAAMDELRGAMEESVGKLPQQ